MTNRFFRNAVGVAALTSLALALACSGSSDPEPGPAVSGKPGAPYGNVSGFVGSAVTKHQYTLSVTEPTGTADSYSVSSNKSSSFTLISGQKGAWTYVPAQSGNDIITVTAKAGSTSGDATVVAQVPVVENSSPSVTSSTFVAPGAGSQRIITLQSKDADGDLVTWGNLNAGGLTGGATGKGTVEVGSAGLTITLGSTAAVGDEFKVKVTSTEKHPTAGYEVYTKEHTIAVTVGSSGAGGNFDWHQGDQRAQISSFPNNADKVSLGVPYIFQFNAGDPSLPNNTITEWHVNGGLSPFNAVGDNEAPSMTWIGQPAQASIGNHYMRPAIGILGPEFEHWRMGIDARTGKSNNDPNNFPGGKLFFVATKDGNYWPDHYSSKVNIGVRADFQLDNVLAYTNFYVSATENEAPVVSGVGTFDLRGEDAFTITVLNKRTGEALYGGVTDPRSDKSVPPEVPWAGKFNGSTKVNNVGVQYKNEPVLVFRHENDNLSYDMAATIKLSGVSFADPDFEKYGDILTFMLDGVTYGDNRTAASGGTSDRVWADYDADDELTADSLRGTKWDVTDVVRPLLSRPYPVMGRDRDAARTYDKANDYYASGEHVMYYEDGRPVSIYQAHAGNGYTYNPETKVGTDDPSTNPYLGETDYNARGNSIGVASATGDYVTLTNVEFLRVPKVSQFNRTTAPARSITGNEGLTFHYRALDLGGHSLPFEIYVPTRGNNAPVLDNYGWSSTSVGAAGSTGNIDLSSGATNLVVSSGDVRGERIDPTMSDVWASSQPSENYRTDWGIVWGDTTNGKTPQRYYLADRPVVALGAATGYTGAGIWAAVPEQAKADPVYLMVPDGNGNATSKQVPFRHATIQNPVTGLEYNNENNKMKAVSTIPWDIAWTPNLYQGRNDYAYTIYGWDKYGAGMRPFEMKGKVFGGLTGEPIHKYLYNNGEVVETEPADLTINGFARVDVNLFFDTTYPVENKLSNMFGIDGDEPHLSINQRDVNAPWRTDIIPHNTNMMISAARTGAGSGEVITGPFIGPAVTSVDGTRQGMDFKSFDTSMTGTPALAASYPTVLWETGNLIPYAYINPTQAEDPAASGEFPDPDKRIVLNLSAPAGSGQLALETDNSLNGDYGKAEVYPVDLERPLPWATGGNFDYYGQMYGIGASGLGEKGVIQISMPSVGQSAFYHPSQSGEVPAGVDPFPSADYDNRLGWFNAPMASLNYKTSNSGLNFYPIAMPIYSKNDDVNYDKYLQWVTNSKRDGSDDPTDEVAPSYGTGLPYTFHIGANGSPSYTLVSLKRTPVEVTPGAATTDGTFPVWKMEKTGVPTRPKDPSILNFDNNDPQDLGNPLATQMDLVHESDWDDLKPTAVATFNAKVNRDSFADFLDRRISRGDATAVTTLKGNVKDTLQVVSYTSGTSLGPVDNHQGLPVFLEFGDLNAQMTAAYKFAGTVDFGSFPIYEPKMWQTPFDDDHSVPVASYIARYTDAATGFSGTMGYVDAVKNIKADTGIAVPTGFAPVSNVRITGLAAAGTAGAAIEWDAAAANNRQTNRGTAASQFIANYYSTGTTLGTVAAAPIYVKAFNDQQNAAGPKVNDNNYKVWLIWDNPAPTGWTGDAHLSNEYAPAISGNIIEFYDAAHCAPHDVPLYKVYVGPSVTAFPIPDAWLPLLGYQGQTNAFPPLQANTMRAIVRIRTVRYGDKAARTFVNFDKAPFKQALPAVWMDTLTTTLSFADVGYDKVKIEAEGAYDGFKKTGQTFTGVDGSYTITVDAVTSGSGTATVATIPAVNILFPGTDLDGSDMTWAVTYVSGSISGSTFNPGPTSDTVAPALTGLTDDKFSGSYTGGVLQLSIVEADWLAAQPTPGTIPDFEDDEVNYVVRLLLEATYPQGANPRKASQYVTVNINKVYGNYSGFPADGGTFTPAATPDDLNQTAATGIEVGDWATDWATTIAPSALSASPISSSAITSGLTVATPGNLTFQWAIGGTGATLSGQGKTSEPITVTLGSAGPNATPTIPTIAITAAQLDAALTGASIAAGNIVVTVPLVLTASYTGETPGATRTATYGCTFTYTITIAP
jgi:hypothetical protein